MRRQWIFLTAFILTGCAVQAQSLAVRNGHVQAALLCETATIQPGKPFWTAISLTMDPGWHIYWKNSGDSGLPIKVQWQLPPGFQAHDLQWPYPQKIDQGPLTSYGYEGHVLLLAQIDAPPDLGPGPYLLKNRLSWLVCAEQCVPGHAAVELSLPASKEAPQPNPGTAQDFSQTRFRLPLDKSEWQVTFEDRKNSLLLRFFYPPSRYPLESVYFFPERNDLINHALPQPLKKTEDGYELSVPRSTLSTGPLTHIKGLLYSPSGWRGPGSEAALNVDADVVPPGMGGRPSAATGNQSPLLLMFLFAFIGGIILNLMPCVLPVLSLKVLSFVGRSKSDKTPLWMYGLVLAAGILASFWVLDALLLVLRAAGAQIGWGFQFQSPGFLIFLSAVFFILALNLFGFFEFQAFFNLRGAQAKSRWLKEFLNGALITLSATPCTAPFMGAALSFSLSQPPIVSFGIFTFLGLGMSFPYFILCFFPPLLRFVPKRGPWMDNFKRFLGVLLLLTVAWLLWVLRGHMMMTKEPAAAPAVERTHGIQWQPFSQELLQQLRGEHRIVFIDFTAKWCLTCQVNERLALNNPVVVAKFKELNVAAVKADWTLQDARIAQVLAGYGRNAIPLYVLYDKNPEDKPILLPELITPKTVLEYLDKVK